jgi:uncharacterized protein
MVAMFRILRWLTVVVLLVAPARVVVGETVAGLPAPPGYVNDFAGVLTPEMRQGLENLCTQVDQKAHAQIAVVTVKAIDADKSGAVPSIEEFSTALEDKWKVGKKGTDRGILMVVSLNPRKYRIEVGYGLEGILNDAKVGDIGREMAPFLRTGDYNQGIKVGVVELAKDIAADAGVSLATGTNGEATAPRYRYERRPRSQLSFIQVVVIGGILLVVIVVLISTGHIGLLFYLLLNLLGGGGRGGGGGGGGDGEGGGGFGGFGGGSSGGGGASGDF